MFLRNPLASLATVALCLALIGAKPALAAPSSPTGTEAVLVKMIEAVKAQSYDDFLTHANARLKSQLSRQQFEGICGLYTTPLRKGYKLEFLGQLRQQGTIVLLWKINVADSQDDTLIRMVMKEGKVEGFSVH
jgi:hypothetical protein